MLYLKGKQILIMSLLLSATTFSLAKERKVLPGVQLVKAPHIYFSETEVSNIAYKEFLYSLKNEPQLLKLNYPDTLGWMRHTPSFKPFVHYYFQHNAYNNYPLVNITRVQAEAYCKWLTSILNFGLENSMYAESEIAQVLVRLPTEREWEFAARGGSSENVFPWGNDGVRFTEGKDRGKLRANFKRVAPFETNENLEMEAGLVSAPVDSYWPNEFDLYNMSGNVSEMVSDANVSKGGSWNSTAFHLQVREREKFAGSDPFTGFRYVVEVIRFKSDELADHKFDPKKIVKKMTLMNDSIFIAQTEVTNSAFNLFLQSENGPDYEGGLMVQDDNWTTVKAPAYMNKYSTAAIFSNHPVVNISHSNARAYCQYLTKRYNNHPRRKYKKVHFRLPTEQEWMLAATNSVEERNLPWNGPFFRNCNGCFLANFHPIEQQYIRKDELNKYSLEYPDGDQSISRGIDGGEFTVSVDSYFPCLNDLYNMAGNVSEMISEPGIVKGGSWASDAGKLFNTSRESISSPNPQVGFRYVMEIVEK